MQAWQGPWQPRGWCWVLLQGLGVAVHRVWWLSPLLQGQRHAAHVLLPLLLQLPSLQRVQA